MKKELLLELSKKGTDFSFKVPAGTSVANIETAMALYIIESAKYREISTAQALAEIQQWVAQLEDNL